jgi:hypothetical protein
MTERARYPRTSCIVPFCRRTSTLFKHERVCAEHWRLVDRDLKRFRTRHLKRLGRARNLRRWHAAEALIWRRMKRQAIERATGVSA